MEEYQKKMAEAEKAEGKLILQDAPKANEAEAKAQKTENAENGDKAQEQK